MTDEELKIYMEDRKKLFTSPEKISDIETTANKLLDNQENMKERYRN